MRGAAFRDATPGALNAARRAGADSGPRHRKAWARPTPDAMSVPRGVE